MFDRTVEAENLVTFKQYLDVSMKNPDQDYRPYAGFRWIALSSSCKQFPCCKFSQKELSLFLLQSSNEILME